MKSGTGYRSGVVQLPWPGFSHSYQFFNGLYWHGGVNNKNVRRPRGHRNRRKIPKRIKGQFLEKRSSHNSATTINSVYPSGAALANASPRVTVGRLSTTTGWPNGPEIPCPIMRALVSAG